MPGKTLEKKSLVLYQNAGIETAEDEIVAIWFKVMSRSSFFKGVAKAITTADPIASECMVRAHLRR